MVRNLRLVEFIANNYPDEGRGINKYFRAECNDLLKQEMSAYRFVATQLVPITSEAEIAALEEALSLPGVLAPVTDHLNRALALLADRETPDYRNSIKEAMSGVEALCRLITGNAKATLGQALAVVESKVGLHAALKKTFESLYGYTSDAEGIRHALLDEPTLDQEDARFMLVACSTFVNYLVEKARKAGNKF